MQAAAWALTPFGEIALAIMALVAAIILIKTHWNQIWTWWKAHPLLAHVITVLMGPIGLLVTAIMDIATHWNTLKTVFTSVVGFILGKISTFLGGLLAVVNVAAKMPGPLGAPFKAMQGPLATAKKHVDDLATSIRNIPTKHNTNVTVHGSGSGGVQAHSTGIFKTQGSMLFYPAARGWKVPGYGGGDRWPALLEGGEAVVPKQLTPQVAPLLKRHGVPGFATGGLAGRAVQIAAALPNATATAEAGFERVNMVAFMKAAIAAAKKEMLSGGAGSSNAIVKDAMQWIGKHPVRVGRHRRPGRRGLLRVRPDDLRPARHLRAAHVGGAGRVGAARPPRPRVGSRSTIPRAAAPTRGMWRSSAPAGWSSPRAAGWDPSTPGSGRCRCCGPVSRPAGSRRWPPVGCSPNRSWVSAAPGRDTPSLSPARRPSPRRPTSRH